MSNEQEIQKDERLIILDTETTGINPREGHRIVEVGALLSSSNGPRLGWERSRPSHIRLS